MASLNLFFFAVFPYLAFAIFVLGSVARYRSRPFTVSSLSSQFLEGRRLFWGSVPFHVGLLVVLAGHLVAFLFPKTLLAWNSVPLRLIILEVSALICGLSVLVGLVLLFVRRLTSSRIRAVTSRADVAIEILLIAQVLLGVWTALGYRWGSSWFAADLTPWLWSLLAFDPKIDAVAAMPLVIQLHVIGGFLILALVPYTRLMHFMVAPLHYVARPWQLVVWHWDRRRARDTGQPWSPTRPQNN